MISYSSASPPLERVLDTMVLVYSLLDGHPAASGCEQLLETERCRTLLMAAKESAGSGLH